MCMLLLLILLMPCNCGIITGNDYIFINIPAYGNVSINPDGMVEGTIESVNGTKFRAEFYNNYGKVVVGCISVLCNIITPYYISYIIIYNLSGFNDQILITYTKDDSSLILVIAVCVVLIGFPLFAVLIVGLRKIIIVCTTKLITKYFGRSQGVTISGEDEISDDIDMSDEMTVQMGKNSDPINTNSDHCPNTLSME
jgi:hypothetical protein